MKKCFLYLTALLPFMLTSCGVNGSNSVTSIQGDTITSQSELLTLIDCDNYVAAIIADPWNNGQTLASYALVPHNAKDRVKIPDGFTAVYVPLSRSIVDSSTNTSAINQLDRLDAIAAVADGKYYNSSDTIAHLISEGRITDIGSSMSPDVETLVEVAPDAILSSPYQNAGHGVIETLGVPVIECADYMETTPLGRAEWLLLLGKLYGADNAASEIFNQVQSEYNHLCQLVDSAATPRPKVLTELLTSGVWYVPGGKSYMARLLDDAGADYPWHDNQSSGSLQLDAASVLNQAADADVWIMRTDGSPTLKSLGDMSCLYTGINAFKNGNVYNCNTSQTTIFNDIAFHPERVLADFIAIFHPDVLPAYETIYYKRVPPTK